MSNPTGVDQSSRENGYRVFRFPEPARQAVGGRPAGETIRTFVERMVEERLPELVVALTRLGLQDPGPARPLRLPLSRTLIGRLSEAGRATGLPASRLLLMVLTGSPPADPSPEKSASKRSGKAGVGGRGAAGGRQKRSKPKAATPATNGDCRKKPVRSGRKVVPGPARPDAAPAEPSDGLADG